MTTGITIDATSRVVDRYEPGYQGWRQAAVLCFEHPPPPAIKHGVRTSRDLLSSDILDAVDKDTTVTLAEGSVNPNK